MATTATPEAKRLVDELVKRLGEDPMTAHDLVAELVSSDTPVDLIGAIDDALSRAAVAEEDDELDDTLWGPDPAREQLAEARQIAQEARGDALQIALEGALTREQAAERLGITPQAVSKRLASGRLIALHRGRAKRLPAWQFHEDGVLPGLAEVIAAYPGTPLALTTWATAPSPDLDDAIPARVMTRRGGVEQVLAAIESLTAAAW